MLRPPLFAIALAIGLGFSAAQRVHAQVGATVRLNTGELRLQNLSTENFTLVAYSVNFPTDELRVAEWVFITGNSDASGDGSFDASGNWTLISPSALQSSLPDFADELTEGALGGGGVLAPEERLYLGRVWDTSTDQLVSVRVATDGQPSFDIPVTYIQPGDYDESGVVDQDDYTLWRESFGLTGSGLLADGNGDEVVNIADFTTWRDNLGAVSPPVVALASSAIALGPSTVVPEPKALMVALISVAILVAVGRKPRHSCC